MFALFVHVYLEENVASVDGALASLIRNAHNFSLDYRFSQNRAYISEMFRLLIAFI